jgi:protein O-GlcNAcase/histone acetyltransferase
MAASKLGGADYLATLGRELRPEIDVFWTGPEIISREITVAHVQELQAVLRRKPLIWDNIHANDYDARRFYCGPYAGRPLELRNAVSGLLSNPNTEFPLNYVPLRTLAEFVRCQGEWNPRKAYLSAMQEWLPQFATIGKPISVEDLIAFGDCYYLPHEEGPEAEALYQLARSLVKPEPFHEPPLPIPLLHPMEERVPEGRERRRSGFNIPVQVPQEQEPALGLGAPAFRQHSTRLRELCVRLTELVDRPLFHALSRRIWELREELDLLEQYVEGQNVAGSQKFPSLTSHLPGTYRGGMVARLQRLLIQEADGTFHP